MKREGFNVIRDKRRRYFVLCPLTEGATQESAVGPYSSEEEAWAWVDNIQEVEP